MKDLTEETARRLKEAGFCMQVEGSAAVAYFKGRPVYARHVLSAVEGLLSSAVSTVQEGGLYYGSVHQALKRYPS